MREKVITIYWDANDDITSSFICKDYSVNEKGLLTLDALDIDGERSKVVIPPHKYDYMEVEDI